MKKADYLSELRFHLAGLPPQEVEDILRDQEEYIREAMSAGRSEDDAIRALGDPRAFAANLTAELKIQRAASSPSLQKQVSGTMGAVVAILALAPLNLIFVLGPFLALVGVAVAGWFTAAAFLASSVAMLGIFFFKLVFVSVGFWTHVSALFFTLGSIGVSILGILVMYLLTQWFVRGTLAYLKWNLKFIQARA